MYFESVKSAEDGMLAVGTVVANRLKSGRYGGSICGVVGQPRQFAPGVLSRRMEGAAAQRARRVAGAVMSGRRHPAVGSAMFFHAAGLRFGYSNMHYVTLAGGNIFYEKRPAATSSAARANALSMAKAYAAASTHKAAAEPVLLASWRPQPQQRREQRVAEVTPIQIRFGPAPVPSDSFSRVSAYSDAAASPEPDSALGVVAALQPKSAQKTLSRGPRVISMSAPVQASMTPVIPTPRPAPALDPVANRLVAQAWSSFN